MQNIVVFFQILKPNCQTLTLGLGLNNFEKNKFYLYTQWGLKQLINSELDIILQDGALYKTIAL